MSHIRGRDTGPEILVRKALFAAGFRFRVNVASLPGTPDIVLRKYHTAVFVNGCFWHGHENCRLYTVPKSNSGFWMQKIRRNRRRDEAVVMRLQARGWKVITVWECSLDKSRRERTISDLISEIRKNGEEYRLEQERRKEARLASRAESALSRVRKSDISNEIHSRYHIPHKIRKASEEYDDSQDFPSVPSGEENGEE